MTAIHIFVALAYLAAGLAALGYLVAPRRVSPRPARVCMIGAFGAHSVLLLLEVAVFGNIPINNLSETLFIFLWFTVLVALFVDRAYRVPSLIAYLMPLMMAFAAPAMLLASRGAGLPKELGRVWLLLHIVPTFLGYGLFTVGFIASVMFLLQEHRLKLKLAGSFFDRLPSLEVLERVARRSIAFGLPVFTLGLIFGMVWARAAGHLLGGPWYTDAKIISGILTWIAYVAIVHVRLAAAWHGRKVAYLTIAGFLFIMFTFVGTFILGGQHAYKASQTVQKPTAATHADQ
jgi:ABC-type transport system involved in cytochrome c biogenesis permease subunit